MRFIYLIIIYLLISVPNTGAVMVTRPDFPEIPSNLQWTNGEPLNASGLRGNVVVLYFWRSSCYECINNFSFLRYIHQFYSDFGLEVIAVHVPEFEQEKGVAIADGEITRLRAPFNVLLDNDGLYAQKFPIKEFPSFYLYDTSGKLRKTFHTQYAYADVNESIQNLIREHRNLTFHPLHNDFNDITVFRTPTPILRFGYQNIYGLGNNDKLVADKYQVFEIPSYIHPHLFYLEGKWRINQTYAENKTPPRSKLKIHFRHKTINLVAATKGDIAAKLVLLINDMPLNDKNRGYDVIISEGVSWTSVNKFRIYNLVDLVDDSNENTLDILFDAARVEIFKIEFSDIAAQYDKEVKLDQVGIPGLENKVKVKSTLE